MHAQEQVTSQRQTTLLNDIAIDIAKCQAVRLLTPTEGRYSGPGSLEPPRLSHDESDVADEHDGLHAASYRGVGHGPVQELRPNGGDDDPFECRPLRLVYADRPAMGELLKVGRGDHVFSAVVEPRPGTSGMGFGDDAQGVVHEPHLPVTSS